MYGCASLSTIVHLIRYGIGPSVIAPATIADELAAGKICLLDMDVAIPDIQFYACWRDSPDSHTERAVAKLARDVARRSKREDRNKQAQLSPEERRVGQECGSTCRSRWSP